MKKLLIPIIFYFACFNTLALKAQSLDEILASHAEVMGFDKLMNVKTIIIEGSNYFGDRSMPFKTIIKKPSQYYSERDFNGQKMLQVLDGEKGWSQNPRNGITDLSGGRLEMLKNNAQFGGMLMNWKEKGLKVSLVGKEDFEGTEVIKLQVENKDGQISELYLDAESFITLKQVSKRTFQGNETTSTVVFSNYKIIDGIAVAFNTKTTSSGQAGGRGGRGMGGGTMVIKTVEFNQDVDDSIFKKPDTSK